ncbi:unnamed protein product, partial [Phaeothamnion confervicola]
RREDLSLLACSQPYTKMADLKLDNEFGSALAGAGSRPAFSNLVKYRQREEVQQREFPTTLRLTNVRVQVGANSADVDAGFRARCNDSGVYCQFRIANEFFKTASFKPDGGAWAGRGDIQFMLASNCSLFVKVLIQSEPEATFGFARINLTGVGDGSFELTSEVKESEYVTPQDEVLGYITVGFTVIPNFALNVSKLENQYDTKNIPALINVISLDSKTLGHRMGTFQSALQILQNIVAEMQRQGAVGAVTSKQLSVILNQASSAQGVELFEDLLWDVASLSFANHIFEPSLAFFPSKPLAEALAESRAAVGDLFDQGSSNAAPWSFALLTEGQDPVVLAADSEADWLRWTAVLRTACDANAEVNAEKLKKLIIAEYCKDPVHPDHPTAGWLRRKKAQKKALTGDYVKRFFKLECDAENHYSLFYGHEPKDCESDKTRTRIMLKEGTRLVLPSMLPIPTPFALQVQVQKVSDFSFQGQEDLRCVVELANQRQRTKAINANETTAWNSGLLLPVQQNLLPHANESVTTVNIGWFGEEITLPSKGDGAPPKLEFSLCNGGSAGGGGGSSSGGGGGDGTCVARASIAFNQLPFGRTQELTLPLEGPNAGNAELTVSVTMRRLGQYKTAWPAAKTRLIQTLGGVSAQEREEDMWEGPCLVRAAPQGLEVFNAARNPGEPGKPVAVVDYYSIEAITAVNDSTLDVAVIIESRPGEAASKRSFEDGIGGGNGNGGGTPSVSPPPPVGIERRLSFNNTGAPGASNHHSRSPTRLIARRTSFGMVSHKGKSLSPPPRAAAGGGGAGAAGGKGGASGAADGRRASGASPPPKSAPAGDYFILRISPCPAETLKDLVRERKWMFRDRSMLLYITHKLHQARLESESQEGVGPVTSDPKTREKLAIASSETYKRIRCNMSEIIKTANWKHARGVGFTEEHIRMFFRLQRLSCYFSKLLESRAHPLWALDDPIDPRKFARSDLDRIFSSQYVQAGTFGAEAQGIENSVKGVGHALKSLHRRMDEAKLFYHDQPEQTEAVSKVFFQEYFLRCIGELGAHVISDEVLQEVPIEVVVAFVCFLVKRDKAFHELLVENSLEPDRNAFLTTILSIDSMIRRLTKRTELEIVAQWPKEGDIAEDAGPYVASLLGDCSPDHMGKLSTRAPEELMRLLEKYVQLIASQCRARGNLGAKIFEGMFFALPSYASNAADTIYRLNHVPCAWNAGRYLSANLKD